MNPWTRFTLTQLVNIPLMLAGWVICLWPTLAKVSRLWWNNDDPPQRSWSWWEAYTWLAWRNPVANLRRVPGVSLKGGPLLYHNWRWRGKEFYYKLGYSPGTGYPMMSFGAGRGY